MLRGHIQRGFELIGAAKEGFSVEVTTELRSKWVWEEESTVFQTREQHVQKCDGPSSLEGLVLFSQRMLSNLGESEELVQLKFSI